MKKILPQVVMLSGLLALGLAGSTLANSAVDGDAPAIMASPQVVVLAKVADLTIHSNIPASSVDFASVRLNGVTPTGLGADSCGHLVARFAIADLALQPGEATLTLTGAFKDGSLFAAADVVGVK